MFGDARMKIIIWRASNCDNQLFAVHQTTTLCFQVISWFLTLSFPKRTRYCASKVAFQQRTWRLRRSNIDIDWSFARQSWYMDWSTDGIKRWVKLDRGSNRILKLQGRSCCVLGMANITLLNHWATNIGSSVVEKSIIMLHSPTKVTGEPGFNS